MRVRLNQGENDLVTCNPELAAEWHPRKNSDLEPQNVYAMSSQLVWWMCAERHEWRQRINTRHKSKCPYCLNQKVWSGYNDIATTHPQLLAEWDFEENAMDPSQTMAGTSKRLHWKCAEGHRWQVSGNNRVNGTNCPYCSNRKVLIGFNDLFSQHPEIAKQWDRYSNDSKSPKDVVVGSNYLAAWRCPENHPWKCKVLERTSEGRTCPRCRHLSGESFRKKRIFESINPLAEEFDLKKNRIQWSDVSGRSLEEIYWWRCEKGHSWQQQLATSVKRAGCPFCSGKRITAGTNDLASHFPALAAEWDVQDNDGLLPTEVHLSSGKTASWKCQLGHKWKARIADRTAGGGCPYCGNKKVLPGFNDLQTRAPELIPFWAFDLNPDTSPSEIFPFTNKAFWWRCKEGHETKRSPNYLQQSGCGYCANRQVLAGWNDVETVRPDLARELDQENNRGVKPDGVIAGGQKVFNWVCELGHKWRATVGSRMRGTGCPFCANRAVLRGFNDLATTDLKLSGEWDAAKNAGKTPDQVLGGGSGKKFWWKCTEGHSWRTTVGHRSSGRGCPRCAKYGFDSSSEGILYFIANDALGARKIGITGTGTKAARLDAFLARGWRVIQKVGPLSGGQIRILETLMMKQIRIEYQMPQFLGDEEMRGTGGATETFEADIISDMEITALIDAHLVRTRGDSS